MHKNTQEEHSQHSGLHLNPQHEYHLVDPSPWPVLTSISLFYLTLSGVALCHFFTMGPSMLCLAIAVLVPRCWRDVVREGTNSVSHKENIKKLTLFLKNGIALLLVLALGISTFVILIIFGSGIMEAIHQNHYENILDKIVRIYILIFYIFLIYRQRFLMNLIQEQLKSQTVTIRLVCAVLFYFALTGLSVTYCIDDQQLVKYERGFFVALLVVTGTTFISPVLAPHLIIGMASFTIYKNIMNINTHGIIYDEIANNGREQFKNI